MNHRRILKVIKTIRESIKGAEYIYTNGSCFQFFLILNSIVPEAEAYYDSDHVITKINGRYYDITGEVECTNHLSMKEHYPDTNLKNTKMKCEFFDCNEIEELRKRKRDNQKS